MRAPDNVNTASLRSPQRAHWSFALLASVALIVGFLSNPSLVRAESPGASVEGTAYGWGLERTLGPGGTFGADDDSTSVPIAAAVGVAGDDTYVRIDAGHESACGLRPDVGLGYGSINCWGLGNAGRLGTGNTTNQSAPVPVMDGANSTGKWSAVDSGAKHVCALNADDSAYCWGDGSLYRLGDGLSGDRWSPVAVSKGENTIGTWKSVSAGGYISCGLSTDGDAYCWGAGSAGGMGNGSTSDGQTPVRVSSGPYRSITAGRQHACAVTEIFTANCWGLNSAGQLGDGTATNSSTPVAVNLPEGATVWQVQAGDVHSCALMADQSIMCWGSNSYGQLGIGSIGETFQPPTIVTGSHEWIDLSVGALTTCAIDSSHQAYCWGYNGSGQVGNGTFTDQGSPVAVDTSGVLNGLVVSGISTPIRLDGKLQTGTLVTARSAAVTAELSSASTLDLGRLDSGQSATRSLTFTNNGSLPIQAALPLTRLSGAQAGFFSITNDTCSAEVIPVGGTCVIEVTSNPVGYGRVSAELSVNPSTPTSHASVDVTVTGPPPPPRPSGPPAAVSATPGDAQANVTWAESETPGTFAVTNYQVESSPAGLGCLVPASTMQCTVVGLRNGQEYSIRVRGLSGAGWGPWSQPVTVTPEAPAPRVSMLITGSRSGVQVIVDGQTTGLEGQQVTPWVRFPGPHEYEPGTPVAVESDGTFTWQDQTRKKVYAYFRSEADQRSNRVVIRP